MLSKEENEFITRVGPGTPMGEFMRQYWIPAMLARELPSPDGPPLRVRLLGEDLIAFRATSGKVGLIQSACMHRGASLFFGRNEEEGLRCVYHGWKYDVSGQCVDMPNEPAARWTHSGGRDSMESSGLEAQIEAPSNPSTGSGQAFKDKIRATAYPCVERGGIIWTYMGPRLRHGGAAKGDPNVTAEISGVGPVTGLPGLPHIEANMQPDGEWSVNATLRNCNYFQGLEGDIDTSHAQFLHHGSIRTENARPGTFLYYRLNDRAPRYAVVDTDFGTMYGAYRPAEQDSNYWRIACYLFPFFTIVPTGLLGHQISMRAWVPLDDEHTLYITMGRRLERPSSLAPIGGEGRVRGQRRLREAGATQATVYEPNSTDWYGRFRLAINAGNDYLIDREQQRRKESFTGIDGVMQQDHAITESEGPIYDRSKENLGSSDAMIVRTRRRLIEAARAFRDAGTVPPGVDDPTVFAVRGGGTILPNDADWLRETEKLRKAFVEHPELDPSVVG